MGDGHSLYLDLRGGYRVYTWQSSLDCILTMRALYANYNSTKLIHNVFNPLLQFSISFRLNPEVCPLLQAQSPILLPLH